MPTLKRWNGTTWEPLQSATYAVLAPAPNGTDDTSAIQALLTAAGAAGGGIVRLQKGTYLVSASLTVPSNVTLEGFGYGTVVKTKTGTNAPVITNADQTNGNTGVIIRHLRADGNRENQTIAFSTIYLVKPYRCVVQDVWARGGKRTGVYPAVSGFGEGIQLIRGSDNRIVNVVPYENDYDGVKLNTSNYNVISNVQAYNNGKGALQLAYDELAGLTDDTFANGSNFNLISNVSHHHDTGTPSAASTTTNCVTLHCASANVLTNISCNGTRELIDYAGSSDNAVQSNQTTGGFAYCRWVGDPFLRTKLGTYNRVSNIQVRALSGVSGQFFELRGIRNIIADCSFEALLDTTGIWTGTVPSGFHNQVINCQNESNMTIDATGSSGTLILAANRDGNFGINTSSQFGGGQGVLGIRSQTLSPTSDPTGGVIAYADGTGNRSAFKIRTAGGAVYRAVGEITAVSSNYTCDNLDRYILATGGTSGITITLPNAGKGGLYTIKKHDAGAGAVTVSSTANIDGSPTYVLSAPNQVVRLLADGTTWKVI